MSTPVSNNTNESIKAEVEPGYKTTEFWLTIITAAGVLFTTATGKNISPEVQSALVVLVVSTYSIARSIRKK